MSPLDNGPKCLTRIRLTGSRKYLTMAGFGADLSGLTENPPLGKDKLDGQGRIAHCLSGVGEGLGFDAVTQGLQVGRVGRDDQIVGAAR